MACKYDDGTCGKVFGHGMCAKHYQRWYKHGDAMIVLQVKHKGNELERFHQKYEIDAVTGCWNWTGTKTRSGYGGFHNSLSKGKEAHRFAYKAIIGDIPDGLVLDHLCRNRSCVNPSHLEPVTHAENVRRGESGLANSSKTHCVNGHEFTEENTFDNHGNRGCRTCRREYIRDYMRERRAKEKLRD